MYQVLIADDEPWIVYGLVHLITWEDFGFTICGTAENGVQALEMCRELRPDLLISDIRMPGMDGIALLDNLRKEELDLHVVFVSGYSEFEYAQSAVRLGAFDYLLKPVEAQSLIDLLNRLILALHRYDQQSYQQSYFALLDSGSDVTVGQWTGNSGDYRCVFFTFDCENCSQADFLRLDALAQISGHTLIFLRTGKEKYLLLLSKSAEKELEPLMDFFRGRHCGVSMKGDASSKLYDLYRQSDIAHCTAILGNAQGVTAYHKEGNDSAADPFIRELQGYLAVGHRELCQKPMDGLEQLCSQGMLLDQVRRIHQRLLSVLQQAGCSGAEVLRVQDYRQIILEYASIPALFAPCKALLAPELRQAEPSAEEILEYVDKNFTKNIRIADIAERFHFSQNYFSTFFRKKTGQTYVKYITGKRISLAKELLEHTELSIQEVADRTEYGDYYQFNRVFKRETDITPSRYREEHREKAV